jgi:uncharacterized protein
MERRRLGKTALELSILGIGGGHALVNIPVGKATELLNHYLDSGGNYVETAAEYGEGESELKIGKVMAHRRDECVLATKCYLRDRAGAAVMMDDSLRRLGVDHVDIMFMHCVATYEELDQIMADDGAIRALEDAQQAGKVRYTGVTLHGQPDVLMAAMKAYPFDVVMSTFNYFDNFNFPTIESELIPLAQSLDIGIVGMKALAGGYLYRSPEQALRYAWSLPITTMTSGMNSREILDMNLQLAETFVPMTEPEREKLYSTAPELGTYVCRQCDKCLPCPEKIDIPGLFRLEGLYDRQMWDGVARDAADYALRLRLRFWYGGEDRARKAYAALPVKAEACIACGDCESRCPYGLRIIDKLRLAQYKLAGGPLF